MTRSTMVTATSAGVGPAHGYWAYQYSVTSPTNIPLVLRQPSRDSGTPRSPKISISASCQRISESISSPSMSKMEAENRPAAGVGALKRAAQPQWRRRWPGPRARPGDGNAR